MVVYIECVFLENTLFDFALLYLSLRLCKTKTRWWKCLLSACVGGIFAVVYPFLALPSIVLILLKITVGCLLSFLAFPCIKTKKDGGRYALNTISFFALTFVYGGALTAVLSVFFGNKAPITAVAIGFAFVTVLVVVFTQKVRQKFALQAHIYECVIRFKQKQIPALGYMDSGNIASKNGLPVCFLSPDIFYDIFGDEVLNLDEKNTKGIGQVRDEMQIITMSGAKSIAVYQAEIEVCIPHEEKIKMRVYFSPAKNMINREYKVLLNAGIIKG